MNLLDQFGVPVVWQWIGTAVTASVITALYVIHLKSRVFELFDKNERLLNRELGEHVKIVKNLENKIAEIEREQVEANEAEHLKRVVVTKLHWGVMTERERMVWAAAYSAAVTSDVFELSFAEAIRRADRAVNLLRKNDPEGSPYR